MRGRNANIYFSEQTYNKLRQVAGVKISRFVNEAVEEKIKKTEQKKQEEFQKKLIAGYKTVAKNNKIQKEQEVWDETISDMWRSEAKTSKKKKDE
jgi:post-segregation antitoxin (ccd killing protein)